jgi:hypothetical protein
MTEGIPGDALLFGSAMHDILENVYRQKRTIDSITVADFKELGKKAVEYTSIAPFLLEGAEKVLDKYNLAPEYGTYAAEGKLLFDDFVAIIDLVMTDKDGKLHIIDWKTTSAEYTEHQIKTSSQLTAYAWAYHRKYGVLPDYVCYVTMNKYTLETRMYRSVRTLDDITEFGSRVAQILKEMEFVNRKNPEVCEGKYGKCFFYNQCWGNRIAEIQDDFIMPSFRGSF